MPVLYLHPACDPHTTELVTPEHGGTAILTTHLQEDVGQLHKCEGEPICKHVIGTRPNLALRGKGARAAIIAWDTGEADVCPVLPSNSVA